MATVAPADPVAKADKKAEETLNTPTISLSDSILFNKHVRNIVARACDQVPPEIREMAEGMKQHTAVCLLLASAGIGCCAYTTEMLYWRRHHLNSDDEDFINFLKIISCASTLLLLLSLTRYRNFEAQILNMKSQIKKQNHYIGYGVASPLVQEPVELYVSVPTFSWDLIRDVLFVLVQPVPFLNNVKVTLPLGLGFQDCTYNIDVFLILMMMTFRLFIFWRCVVAHSRFWDQRSLFTCTFSLVDPGGMWTFYRYYHRLYPITLHSASVILCILVGGYAFYVFERASDDWHLADPDWALKAGAPNSDAPVNFYNSMWFMTITAGTVGYGEWLCHTFVGRALVMVSVGIGILGMGNFK